VTSLVATLVTGIARCQQRELPIESLENYGIIVVLSATLTRYRRYKMSIVVAFDPGLVTGVATVNTDNMANLMTFEYGWQEVCNHLQNLYRSNLPDEYVYETFTITEGTAKLSPNSAPMDVIGAIKYVATLGCVRLTAQRPYDAKHFATDDRLKTYGWYTRGRGHSNDASRHLFLYCAKHGYIQFDSEGSLICPT